MASNVVFNGVTYSIPVEGDSGWGPDLTNFFISIAANSLQKTAGNFPLTAELNFGATYGLKLPYIKSAATNPGATGFLRMGNGEAIAWRNADNTATLSLLVDSGNNLNFNGASLSVGGDPVQTALTFNDTSTIDFTKTGDNVSADIVTGSISNSLIASAAAIATTKLAAVTGDRALMSNGGGFMTASSVTATELGYLSGVSSSIQTQLTAKISASSTDTLTNKTINASNNTLTNVSLTTAVTGTLPVANGGTGVTSFAKGDLLVTPGASVVNKLAVGADGTVLTADSTQTNGIRWGSTLTNPMTTAGDLIYGGVSGAPNRLANGTSGQMLRSAGGTSAPTWSDSFGPSTGGKIVGTNTNDNAAAGLVGEYISANASGATNPTVNGAVVNLMSMSLTAGDWDVEAMVYFSSGTATGIQYVSGGISLANNTIPTNQTGSFLLAFPFASGLNWQLPTGTRRVSINTTTTVYLNATLNFASIGTGSFTTNTFMRARRVR